MTEVYFVRHAQSRSDDTDDRTRRLTETGKRDSEAVSWVLADRGITYIASSPYTRAIDTVSGFAELVGLPVNLYEDLRERNYGGWHGENFFEFIERQWSDFDYHIEDGECLRSVQERNIRVLKQLLAEHRDGKIAVATHGTALSSILNYYYPQFGFESFMKIVDFMPFVIRLDFDGEECINAQVELVIHRPYKKK